MDKVGVIHGRFQMLHIGHMEYLLAGKKRCKYLLIGIANPDVSLTKFSNANPHRSVAASNPLTYLERLQMISGAMLEAGVKRSEFDIVPFPINYPDLLFNYVPRNAKYYMTIYDEWSMEKLSSLKALGYNIDIMWTRTNADKITSGTEVRNLITTNKPWEHLVPKSVCKYITDNQIDLRLRNMTGKEE
jgi:nicotinamide-nucleotide adenylyltransferase/phosphinothricin biosynthesis protein PhpF